MKILTIHHLVTTTLLFTSILLYGQSNDRILEIETQLKELDNRVVTMPYSLVDSVDALRNESIQLGATRNAIMSNLVLAKAYEHQKNYDQAFHCIDNAFAIADSAGYRDLDYMLNFRTGFILLQQGENTDGIGYLEKCQKIAIEGQNASAQGQSLLLIGFAHTKNGDFDKAITYLDSASTLLQKINDDVGLQRLYSYMGVYYSRVGERDKAIDQYQKALDLSVARRDTDWMITSHLNLLSMYAITGDVDKAFEHYRERNKLIERIEYPEDRKVDLNIGILYVQSEQYENALDVLNTCRSYYEKEGNIYRVALCDHWKAIAYRGMDRYDLAAEQSLAAYAGANTSGNKKLAELSAYTLFQTYHWRGNNTQAIEWLITSNTLRDSIYSEEKKQEMLALETKYETFRKEQEIEILKAKNEAERAKRNMLLLLFTSTFLIGGLFVYYQIAKHRREKELQVQKLKNVELERARLEDQLQYKEKQLASQLLQMAQKNEFLSQIHKSLEEMRKGSDGDHKSRLQKVIHTITEDIASDETWEHFLTAFKEIHHKFIETLTNKFQLTGNEVRLAAMLKMNMSSKEISNLLNISDAGIMKARYRLRKKLGLDSSVNMQTYLLGME